MLSVSPSSILQPPYSLTEDVGKLPSHINVSRTIQQIAITHFLTSSDLRRRKPLIRRQRRSSPCGHGKSYHRPRRHYEGRQQYHCVSLIIEDITNFLNIIISLSHGLCFLGDVLRLRPESGEFWRREINFVKSEASALVYLGTHGLWKVEWGFPEATIRSRGRLGADVPNPNLPPVHRRNKVKMKFPLDTEKRSSFGLCFVSISYN